MSNIGTFLREKKRRPQNKYCCDDTFRNQGLLIKQKTDPEKYGAEDHLIHRQFLDLTNLTILSRITIFQDLNASFFSQLYLYPLNFNNSKY
jgi:hypothetical protein